MSQNSNSTSGQGPLAGIRVLEIGQLIAGPFTGCFLGYFGAEVIKVEAPGDGDPIRKWRILIVVAQPWSQQEVHYGQSAHR